MSSLDYLQNQVQGGQHRDATVLQVVDNSLISLSANCTFYLSNTSASIDILRKICGFDWWFKELKFSKYLPLDI